MLAGIYAHEELAESWIFKGGTCLKKCFFETYRFSEDLDFTLRDEAQLDEKLSKAGVRRGWRVEYMKNRHRNSGRSAGIRNLSKSPRQALMSGQDQLQGTGFAHPSASADQT